MQSAIRLALSLVAAAVMATSAHAQRDYKTPAGGERRPGGVSDEDRQYGGSSSATERASPKDAPARAPQPAPRSASPPSPGAAPLPEVKTAPKSTGTSRDGAQPR